MEGIYINLQLLYFIIHHCFIENKSLDGILTEAKEFAKTKGKLGTTKVSLSNIYEILRNKIRKSTHYFLFHSFLGEI